VQAAETQQIVFSEPLFHAYLSIAREAFAKEGIKEKGTIDQFALQALQRREVLDVQSKEASSEDEQAVVKEAVLQALEKLIAMREAEGKALETDLLQRAETIERTASQVLPLSEQAIQDHRKRLEARIQKFTGAPDVDETRIAQEIVYFTDRSDVSEEVTRLTSHIAQLRSAIASTDGGKKLEFLLQEMGREVNTIGSKAQHAGMSKCVVEMKTELEKMREQIQNVE
jgi:uncharacterized protein (TIGR00255 family)